MVAADGGHNERINADGANCMMVAADGEHSERSSAYGINSGRRAGNAVISELNGASDCGNSQLNIGSQRVRENAAKRGRAKMSRTELKMVPRTGRVELAPRGHR
ncbi:hypothetical protein C2845_PM15G07700 [Panicum miliaceum]|uniref:Uncharacterized protein n=1 Tax=Panicum miliaceum TaxID=4540 RepID=A0A3L6Q8C4_PANMI|nr:hypothetical protein C2845_PM15G07700 [Panicum miliaceum]